MGKVALRASHADTVSVVNMKSKQMNLTNYFKPLAEAFLAEHQALGKIPKKISGILTPRFGEYIMVWQYENNKLVGAVSINIKNADNAASKIKSAVESIDYISVQEANKWLESIGAGIENGDVDGKSE